VKYFKSYLFRSAVCHIRTEAKALQKQNIITITARMRSLPQ